MITAGIDAGIEYTKAVILKDGIIIGRGIGRSGGIGRVGALENIWRETLRDAGLTQEQVTRVTATGKWKLDAVFADSRITEPVAAAAAAAFLLPGATAVVNTGADETLAATLDGGKLKEFTVNEKCAAGLGIFLTQMAKRLELDLDEMSGLSAAPDNVTVNDGCVVFAELDVLELLNTGVLPLEIAAACTEAVAVRTSGVINDITMPDWTSVLLTGGLAKNRAFINALKKQTDIDFIVPDAPEYACALGAALIAANEAECSD